MDWLKRSQEAFEGSTNYIHTNLRSDWDYSLRAFRNEHAANSKYNSPEYTARSRLFRPKTRSIIRKNEAAAAVALFSNMEVINIEAVNPDDPMNVAAASAIKELIEYRLNNSIPAFEIVMGGVQDAQTQGLVCSYQYWEYQEKDGRRIKDKPCIELRPIENIRFDAGASWTDPVNTSPYFADVIPMYVCDVKGMTKSKDPKTKQPKWKSVTDAQLQNARPDAMEEARLNRMGKGVQDPHKEPASLKEFETVWVIRWFMKDSEGDDYTYYTLGTETLLTDPKPIEEVYFHGQRPYVIGYAILETHKAHKTSMPMLIKPLQQETNAIANSRIDNVLFVLHKRWLVARGRQVDVNSLVRGVPGGVTLTTDPRTDVVESNWPDVTSSAYVEQDRINADMDDVAGNFSPSTKVANNAINDTLGGSRMASQGAGVMTDYLIRTILETWWEKVLRQFVLLEQYYETDQTVLMVCAQKAQLFKKYQLLTIHDELLTKGVNVTVNVGMGSSNPAERFQKLIQGTMAVMQVAGAAANLPTFNIQEFVKEAYANMGYRDGARFWNQQIDPRLAMAMQQIQMLQQQVQGKGMELQAKAQIEDKRNQTEERIAAGDRQLDGYRIQGDLQIRQSELELEKARIDLEAFQTQADAQGAIEENKLKLAQLQMKVKEAVVKLQATIHKAQSDRENARLAA